MNKKVTKQTVPFKLVFDGRNFEENAMVRMIMARDNVTYKEAHTALKGIKKAIINAKEPDEKDEAVSRILCSADNFDMTIMEAVELWFSELGEGEEKLRHRFCRPEKQVSTRNCRMAKCTKNTVPESYYWCQEHRPGEVDRETDDHQTYHDTFYTSKSARIIEENQSDEE